MSKRTSEFQFVKCTAQTTFSYYACKYIGCHLRSAVQCINSACFKSRIVCVYVPNGSWASCQPITRQITLYFFNLFSKIICLTPTIHNTQRWPPIQNFQKCGLVLTAHNETYCWTPIHWWNADCWNPLHCNHGLLDCTQSFHAYRFIFRVIFN